MATNQRNSTGRGAVRMVVPSGQARMLVPRGVVTINENVTVRTYLLLDNFLTFLVDDEGTALTDRVT